MKFRLAVLTLLIGAACTQNRNTAPKNLPKTFDTAVGICLDLIERKPVRNTGEFRKSDIGWIRVFADDDPGVLPGKVISNGSKQAKLRVFLNYGDCEFTAVRLGGGFGTHYELIVSAFIRRGWQNSRSKRQLTKDGRILSHQGRPAVRNSSGDLLTDFLIIEWIKDTSGNLVRRR